jgi:hypothetical protein
VIGKQERWQEDLFVAGPLSSLVPDDHILKQVDTVLDLSWLRDAVADCYCNNNGRQCDYVNRGGDVAIVKETNIKLTGVPDDIFQASDGYTIIDYKTARFTGHQDSLLPIYQVQLNGYALIGEQTDFAPVKKLLLVYYEPHGGILEVDDLDGLLLDDGFKMPYNSHCLELDLDPEKIVKPLLKEVRRIGNMDEAPASREGCSDCLKLEEVVNNLKQQK